MDCKSCDSAPISNSNSKTMAANSSVMHQLTRDKFINICLDIDKTLIKSFKKTKGSNQVYIDATIDHGFEPLCSFKNYVVFARKDAQWFIKKLLKIRKSSAQTQEHDLNGIAALPAPNSMNTYVKVGFFTHGKCDYAKCIVKSLLGVKKNSTMYKKIDFLLTRDNCNYELYHQEFENKYDGDHDDVDWYEYDNDNYYNCNYGDEKPTKKHFNTIKQQMERLHYAKFDDDDNISFMDNNMSKIDHKFIFIDDCESPFLKCDKQAGLITIFPFTNYQVYDENDKVIANRLNKHDYQLRKIYKHIIKPIVKYNFTLKELALKQLANFLHTLYDMKHGDDIDKNEYFGNGIDWNDNKLTQLGNKLLIPLKNFIVLVDKCVKHDIRHLYFAAVRLYFDVAEQVLFGGGDCRHSHNLLREVYHINIVDLKNNFDYFTPFIMSACMYICIRMNDDYTNMQSDDEKEWQNMIQRGEVFNTQNCNNDVVTKNSKTTNRLKLGDYVDIVKLFMLFPPIFPGLMQNKNGTQICVQQSNFFKGFEKYCQKYLFDNCN